MHHLFSILDRTSWYAAIRVCKKWYGIGISDYVIQKIFECQNYKELIEQTKKNYYLYTYFHTGIFKTYLGILHLISYNGSDFKRYHICTGHYHIWLSQNMQVKKSFIIHILENYKLEGYLNQINEPAIYKFLKRNIFSIAYSIIALVVIKK